MQKLTGAPGAPEPNERDRAVGHRRRLALSALLACAVLVGAVSLGALAQQPAPAAETPSPPAETRAVLPPEAGETPVPTPEPTPTPVPAFDFTQPAPETAAVEDDWFSDAVFIGDSRTDGLRLYSGIRGADFLAYKSLMIFHVVGNDKVDRKAVPLNGVGDKKTVLEWLDEKQYAKVYLMFGVNELGYGDDAAFTDAFSRTVDEIRARQPEAVVYIQSLVPIEPEKAYKTNPAAWLNNDNVARYNELLRQVCADKGVVYVDVASALVNDAGNLPPEGTTDGIHFTRSWYEKWYAYLKTHTVDPAEYAAGQPVAETEEMSE
ncbi:GDSL-type esterase/lipase family protein [Intestinimonas timonensis]|uniref:GDSL-type esterase/lipase family protein n=1 Tax=Intestinimonas timonensis TaxID=1689270 RepID=UPI003A9241D7